MPYIPDDPFSVCFIKPLPSKVAIINKATVPTNMNCVLFWGCSTTIWQVYCQLSYPHSPLEWITPGRQEMEPDRRVYRSFWTCQEAEAVDIWSTSPALQPKFANQLMGLVQLFPMHCLMAPKDQLHLHHTHWQAVKETMPRTLYLFSVKKFYQKEGRSPW